MLSARCPGVVRDFGAVQRDVGHLCSQGFQAGRQVGTALFGPRKEYALAVEVEDAHCSNNAGGEVLLGHEVDGYATLLQGLGSGGADGSDGTAFEHVILAQTEIMQALEEDFDAVNAGEDEPMVVL